MRDNVQIKENPDGTAGEFKRLPPHVFNEIKDNNTIADAFLDSNRNKPPSLDDLIESKNLSYEFGIKYYVFSSYKKHIYDLNTAIKNSDEDDKKRLSKVRDMARIIERNFQIISNLAKNNIIDEQRPLTFFPNAKKQRLFIGSEEKNTVHNVVPLNLLGKNYTMV